MRTTQQIMDAIGYDRGVCCGHGDYQDLPARVTPEIVTEIRREALLWAVEQIVPGGNTLLARERIIQRALSV